MPNDRFLLIKAWSYILWEDVKHVLGQLLIAELTDRIPVVYWPTHCLHNGFVYTNGFELYFEPISNYTIFDIVKPEYTYYPPVWDHDNLLVEDQSKETWIYRNIGEIMSSNANVVVSDVYFDVYKLIPFIKKSHSAYGMTVQQIYRYLFNKYIKIKQDINIEIEGFYNSWLKDDRPVLAVHVRRVDKDQVFDLDNYKKNNFKGSTQSYSENQKNSMGKHVKIYKLRKKRKALEPNKIYHEEISKYIEKYNVKKIFLLTDCEETLKEYQQKYGSMVVSTECKRIPIDGEASYMENPMVKRRRGIEIIKDTYLAAKCDFFIGNDFSSLSHAVTNIQEWPNNNIRLLYYLFKKRKYPVNVELLACRKKSIFRVITEWIKKLFKKD
ncbi:O-fucosyltransferase family protein [Desulfitobacterium sp.]|uniref:O-fucosyltransferase family protein n=1 Tax=Desulfitobacterium sp. TaxID=49981 RepID=UPI002BFF6135|nr:O-fucosyltransferase family protein [Desulfitobacterium sp.]HVJ48137.1 O-fucosyltransferase family protein [Desulfitobacterium sp.]